MLTPVSLPDELFASVMARLGRLNGIKDVGELAECCFGLRSAASLIGARLRLPELCAHHSHAYGDPERLLDELTCLGARRCLGEIDEANWKALVEGAATTSIADLTFFGAAELRYCSSCREHDAGQYGVAYWHRTHQLPILHRCTCHGERLKKAPIRRASLHHSFPLPGDFIDEVVVDMPVVWDSTFEFELEAFIAGLLTRVQPRQDLVDRVMFDGLLKEKFLSRSGSLRGRELMEFLHSRACQDEDAAGLEEHLARFLRYVIRSVRDPAKGFAFGRAVLLNALFGNWRIVEERCNWLDVVGSSFEYVARENDVRSTYSLRERCRQKCMAYVADNPEFSRLGFTRKDYRSFRWLLHHDRAWLEHILPVMQNKSEQRCLF